MQIVYFFIDHPIFFSFGENDLVDRQAARWKESASKNMCISPSPQLSAEPSSPELEAFFAFWGISFLTKQVGRTLLNGLEPRPSDWPLGTFYEHERSGYDDHTYYMPPQTLQIMHGHR